MPRTISTVVVVPTLLALLGPWGGAALAATAEERDVHAEALGVLIDRDYRLPAKRQLAAYRAAQYPDDGGWFGKCLEWQYADRFRTRSVDDAERKELSAKADSLRAELEQAEAAGKLPEWVSTRVKGGGKMLRLVNDLGEFINADRPAPQLGIESIPVEKRSAAQDTVKTLIAAAQADWDGGMKKLKDFLPQEEEADQAGENDPKARAVIQKGVMLRLEIARSAALAVRALREVAERGAEYGLDPAPAAGFLKTFSGGMATTLGEWDMQFSDMHPYLHYYILSLMGEAVRWKAKGLTTDDVEEGFQLLIGLDVGKEFGDPRVRDEVRTLQVKTWAERLTWRRLKATDQDFARGVTEWEEFQKLARTSGLRLDDRNQDRAVEIARTHFAAARLLKAKGDMVGATAAAAAVGQVRSNPLAANAREWVGWINGGGPNRQDVSWGQSALPVEPNMAISTAKTFLGSVRDASDPARRRAYLVNAAVALRGGILGLNVPDWQAGSVAIEPELWARYADALSQLGLRWHAAIAARAGLESLAATIAGSKTNPWRTAKGEWNETGKHAQRLARNAIVYANGLSRAMRGSGTNDLWIKTVDLVKKVSPEDAGANLDLSLIYGLIEEGDFDRAVEEAKAFQKKYPDRFYDAVQVQVFAMRKRYAGAKKSSPEQRQKLETEMLAYAGEVQRRAKDDLGKTEDPAQRRILERAANTVLVVQAEINNAKGDFQAQLKTLGPAFWRNPPADEETSAQLMRYLCLAVKDWYKLRVSDEKARLDPQTMLADWAVIAGAYEAWRVQKERMPAQAESLIRTGQALAFVMQNVVILSNEIRKGKAAPARIGEINAGASRAYADLVAPTLGAASRPELLLSVANALWSLNEHARALPLLQWFIAAVEADPEVATIDTAPAQLLDPLDPTLGGRPELREQWKQVRDLLIDDPGLAKKIIEGIEEKDWGEKRRDFGRAIDEIVKLREAATKMRTTLGKDFAQVDASLDKLRILCGKQVQRLAVMANLAAGLRETGDKAGANAMYDRLIAYDPTNLVFQAAIVEMVIDRLRDGIPPVPGKDELERARQIAAVVRGNVPPGDRDTYWTACIQVLELSAALGGDEIRLVNQRMTYDRSNRSTPADELQQLPREKRDHKDVRRARNPLSVELARRYLKLFELPGIDTQKNVKPYRIDQIAVDDKTVTLFLPVDAPAFAPVTREIEGGMKVTFFWPEGQQPPPEEAPKPSPAPEAEPPADKPAEKPADKPAPATDKPAAPGEAK
jgi:hypothetical protein